MVCLKKSIGYDEDFGYDLAGSCGKGQLRLFL